MKALILTAAIAAGLTLTACETYADGHAAKIKAATTSAGKILITPEGMSLYTFDNDAGGKSNCDGDCAAAWPPFAAPANATKDGNLTPITRNDGSMQWAYKGQPLYAWAGDTQPGDVTGDGVGGVWHLARP